MSQRVIVQGINGDHLPTQGFYSAAATAGVQGLRVIIQGINGDHLVTQGWYGSVSAAGVQGLLIITQGLGGHLVMTQGWFGSAEPYARAFIWDIDAASATDDTDSLVDFRAGTYRIKGN